MNANPSRRRAVRGVLNIVVLLGVLTALSPALQHAYSWWSQRQLLAQWDAASQSEHKPSPRKIAPQPRKMQPKTSRTRVASVTSASAITMSGQSDDERPLVPLPSTRLSIPEIGVDAVVVQGLDAKALARGPGHDPNSALPGEEGNCVLAAHRNVYGSWFYNLDQLWSGSVAEVRSGGQTFRYTIVGVRTVSEADNSVLKPVPGAPPSLTLITCTLPHSPFRLVATGYLQSQ